MITIIMIIILMTNSAFVNCFGLFLSSNSDNSQWNSQRFKNKGKRAWLKKNRAFTKYNEEVSFKTC